MLRSPGRLVCACRPRTERPLYQDSRQCSEILAWRFPYPVCGRQSPTIVSSWKEEWTFQRLKLLRLVLISRLGLSDRADQFGQAIWIHVADRNHFEIARVKSHHMKSGAFGRQLIRLWRTGLLLEKDGDPMLANTVK